MACSNVCSASEAQPILEPGRQVAPQQAFPQKVMAIAVLCSVLLAASFSLPSSSKALVSGYAPVRHELVGFDAEKKDEPKDDNGKEDDRGEETPKPEAKVPEVPGAKTLSITGFTGPIDEAIVSGKDLTTIFQEASKVLEHKGLIDKDCGQCEANKDSSYCCFDVVSFGRIIPDPESVKPVTDIPGLGLQVIITYEKMLSKDLVQMVRDMRGIDASQREKLCEQFRQKDAFDTKQLRSVDTKALLEGADIKAGSPNHQAVQDVLAAEAVNPNAAKIKKLEDEKEMMEARKWKQELMDQSLAEAKAVQAEAQASTNEAHDNAAAQTQDAVAAVKAVAAKELEKVESKLSIDLGKANLEEGSDKLKALAAVKNDGALAKGTKLNTIQLIQKNNLLGGLVFHNGVVDSTGSFKHQVLQFSESATAILESGGVGSSGMQFKSATGLKALWGKDAYSVDVLDKIVVQNPLDSTTERIIQTESAVDSRRASKLFDTYGAHASSYVKGDVSAGLSIGSPGIYSASAAAAYSQSKKNGKSEQTNDGSGKSSNKRSHKFFQESMYMEPRATINIPTWMVKADPRFTDTVRELYTKGSLEKATQEIFHQYGTHVCLDTTLGGSWTIYAEATSTEEETLSELMRATATATQEATASAYSVGASVAGMYGTTVGALTIKTSQGQAQTDEKTTAGGDAAKTAFSSRNITTQTSQEWKGGLSGGSASAWRLSLEDAQNSNWRIIGRTFEDCVPVWAFYPTSSNHEWAKVACKEYYKTEVAALEAPEKAKLALKLDIKTKCEKERDSTRLGVMEKAYRGLLDIHEDTTRKIKNAEAELNALEAKKKMTQGELVMQAYKFRSLAEHCKDGKPKRFSMTKDNSYPKKYWQDINKACWDKQYIGGIWKEATKDCGSVTLWCLKGDAFWKGQVEVEVDVSAPMLQPMVHEACAKKPGFAGGWPAGSSILGGLGAICLKELSGIQVKSCLFKQTEKIKFHDMSTFAARFANSWEFGKSPLELCGKDDFIAGIDGNPVDQNDDTFRHNEVGDTIRMMEYCLPDPSKNVKILDYSRKIVELKTEIANLQQSCIWAQPHDGADNTFLCEDGQYVESKCEDHGPRVQCPPNKPKMCNKKTCGGKDWCCRKTCRKKEGERPCPAK